MVLSAVSVVPVNQIRQVLREELASRKKLWSRFFPAYQLYEKTSKQQHQRC